MRMQSITANHLAAALKTKPRSQTGRFARFSRFLLAALVGGCLLQVASTVRADDAPDPHDILKAVRLAQSQENRALTGDIRTGGKNLPFKLISSNGTIRYEFTDPTQVIQLRLGDKEARLDEITDGKSQRVTPRRFDDRVRDTDISYEDLSMGFLYWPQAKIQGEQIMLLQKCWIIRVEPSNRKDSQYSMVDLWISKKNGALMQAEAFDANSKLARKFKVISGQPVGDGLWILKEMRIESFGGRSKDSTPTYLDIDKPAN